ncbi:MAG: hypothetical protein H7124_08905 [Phycisphaerales bacterium]|nr:hypothetical protein [Hyphomonadaceae bacterium]
MGGQVFSARPGADSVSFFVRVASTRALMSVKAWRTEPERADAKHLMMVWDLGQAIDSVSGLRSRLAHVTGWLAEQKGRAGGLWGRSTLVLAGAGPSDAMVETLARRLDTTLAETRSTACMISDLPAETSTSDVIEILAYRVSEAPLGQCLLGSLEPLPLESVRVVCAPHHSLLAALIARNRRESIESVQREALAILDIGCA